MRLSFFCIGSGRLHPRLRPGLADECRLAASRSQMFVTTHSPFFVNGLRPEETWALYRNQKGFPRAVNINNLVYIPGLMKAGALLGHLWMEGHFEVGDPLTAHGNPTSGFLRR